VGLVFLDVGSDGAAEPLQGWQAYDELLRAFARCLAGLRDEGILGPRDVVAVPGVRADKFLLFLRGTTPPFDAASLEAGPTGCATAQEMLPSCLPPASAGPVLFHQGHALMYRDPMLRAERSIHQGPDEAMFMSFRQRTREEDRRAQGLDELIERSRS
jgi:hypothetical protein